MNILELAAEYKELRDKKDEIENTLSDVKDSIDKKKKELVECMIDDEIQNFTHSGLGLQFYIMNKMYVNAVKGKKPSLLDALKENGFEDVVQETVHSSTLRGLVKEQIEQNEDALPEWLEGLVNVHEDNDVGMRKAVK